MAGIAFTYELTTAVGQVRFHAGDTDPEGLNRTGGDRTRSDTELQFLLDQREGDVRGAAADLLEGKAAEYAFQAGRTTEGRLQQDWTARSSRCLEIAQALRANTPHSPARSVRQASFSFEEENSTVARMERW